MRFPSLLNAIPGLSLLLLAALIPLAGCVSFPGTTPRAYSVSVRDFGAAPDGSADCTGAFQRALDAVAAGGGGVVHVPTGRYRVEGVLNVPDHVCLEGVWRAPVRGEPPDQHGSVLLAFAGKGDPDGPPFLTMNENSVLKGVTVYYPEQVRANPPIPYPWTVRGNGKDNIAIIDVTMINSYQAVDLGTKPCGRHLVRNLHAYALFKGLYVNQCYDVGRLENIHFWPFWDLDPNSPLWEFTRERATAFILGKTDGEMANGLFCIFYNVGMHFIDGPIYDAAGNVTGYAAGSGMYTNCYLDVSPCAIKVDAVMDTAGVSFVNGSIMSNVVVGPKNRGPVKFVGCGFWATRELASHATLDGRGAVIFNGCQFNDWDRAGAGAPCIDANNSRLIVSACDFPTTRDDHQVLRLGPRVRAAVVLGNTMPGGVNIINNAWKHADIQIGFNAVGPKPHYVSEWLSLGPFPNPEVAPATPDGATRAGIDIDYLRELGGEARAVI
ncbi:MAG TPA: glycosyl hydrolase family 28-related protein, partial [Candidatus Hydrogenedentes bacterium]|nr:glycosyl hydrolase family 28-related protein [Candidatus Hydrogenedentota bacterium]